MFRFVNSYILLTCIGGERCLSQNAYRESGNKLIDRYLKLNRLSENSKRRVRFRGYIYHGLWWDVAKVYVMVYEDFIITSLTVWGGEGSHPIPRCWTLPNQFRQRNQFHLIAGIRSQWILTDSGNWCILIPGAEPVQQCSTSLNRMYSLEEGSVVGTNLYPYTLQHSFYIVFLTTRRITKCRKVDLKSN